MAITKDEVKSKIETSKKEGFSEWLDKPLVKAMISMVPEGPHPDLLRLILHAAYDAGFDAGGAQFALQAIEQFTSNRPPRP